MYLHIVSGSVPTYRAVVVPRRRLAVVDVDANAGARHKLGDDDGRRHRRDDVAVAVLRNAVDSGAKIGRRQHVVQDHRLQVHMGCI